MYSLLQSIGLEDSFYLYLSRPKLISMVAQHYKYVMYSLFTELACFTNPILDAQNSRIRIFICSTVYRFKYIYTVGS